jgi:hypothetical protein
MNASTISESAGTEQLGLGPPQPARPTDYGDSSNPFPMRLQLVRRHRLENRNSLFRVPVASTCLLDVPVVDTRWPTDTIFFGRGLFIDNCDAALAVTKPGISVEAPNSLFSIRPPSVVLYLPGTLYGQK